MALTELERLRRTRELGALRVVAVARLGVAALMMASTFVNLKPKWPQYNWVPWVYGGVAVVAALLLFTRAHRKLDLRRTQLVLLVLDVTAIFIYKVAAADGAIVPLLILTLLPIMVVLEVSRRRAAVALAVIAGTFAIEIFTDPVILAQADLGPAAVATAIFVFLCCTAYLAVRTQSGQLDEITRLSASRQELLVDLMAASDEQQRKVSEYIHDGPLQSVLMARQDIVATLKKRPDESLERALAGLREATDQMREATFELHPAVLAGAGLTRALTQLAAASSARSGIDIVTDIEHPQPDPTDPMVYAVARELLSNIVKHSRASRANVRFRSADGMSRLDVVDDGVGISAQAAAERLAQGHIGLASQRARIEAAGGELRVVPTPVGTHVAVTVPMVGVGD